MRRAARVVGAVVGLSAGLTVENAAANGLFGVWERSSGMSRVRFAPCGDKICGTVVWLKEPKTDGHNPDKSKRGRSVMGLRVFFDVVEQGDDHWTGKAYNTDDGETYGGRIVLNEGQLFTSGCVIAGLVCTTVRWTRVR
jgi:uncharacterized protein (DUF2147 family)